MYFLYENRKFKFLFLLSFKYWYVSYHELEILYYG